MGAVASIAPDACMADRVARQYADNRRSEAAWRAANWSPERTAACYAMQDAFVAYVRAFGVAYPSQAHLLPDAARGHALPEFRASVEASDRYEAAIRAERSGRAA